VELHFELVVDGEALSTSSLSGPPALPATTRTIKISISPLVSFVGLDCQPLPKSSVACDPDESYEKCIAEEERRCHWRWAGPRQLRRAELPTTCEELNGLRSGLAT